MGSSTCVCACVRVRVRVRKQITTSNLCSLLFISLCKHTKRRQVGVVSHHFFPESKAWNKLSLAISTCLPPFPNALLLLIKDTDSLQWPANLCFALNTMRGGGGFSAGTWSGVLLPSSSPLCSSCSAATAVLGRFVCLWSSWQLAGCCFLGTLGFVRDSFALLSPASDTGLSCFCIFSSRAGSFAFFNRSVSKEGAKVKVKGGGAERGKTKRRNQWAAKGFKDHSQDRHTGRCTQIHRYRRM